MFKRPERLSQMLLVLMLAVAAGVRLAGLGWGLPTAQRICSYHPDEAPLLSAVAYMLRTGDWNAHFFNYGTLYLYLVAIPGALCNLVLPDSWVRLFWISRLWTVALGVTTVWLVYHLGQEAGGRRLGLAAGWLMALLPMHLVHAHFATVDVPATCLVTVALFACARITVRAQLGWFVLAGAAAGLAAATKYSAGLVLIALVAAYVLGVGEGRHRVPPREWLYVGLIAAAVAFLVACPFLLEWQGGVPRLSPDFGRDFSFELRHARQGGTFAFAGVGNGWAYHLARSLGAGLGYPLLVLALAGMALAPWSMGRQAWPGMIFGLTYFGLMGAGKEYFMRYLLPLTPLLALWPAALVVWCTAALRQQKRPVQAWAMASLGAAVWGLTAWYGLAQLWPFTHPDPRQVAGQALLAGKGKIGLANPPWYYTPDVTLYNGGQLTARMGPPDPRLLITGWDAGQLLHRRPPVVAISDLESTDLLRLQAEPVVSYFHALQRRYQVAAVYETALPWSALGPGKAHAPPDWLYARPRITIYRLR